jgi:hypothetical protein
MLTIMSSDCTNCEGTNFNYSVSTHSVKLGTTPFQRNYGSGSIRGYRYKDAVYVDQAQTQGGIDMEYFLIT